MSKSKKQQGPKILLLDIETAPILAYVWGLWENNVALNQIKSDWYVLSWSAKWLHDPADKIMYMDQRKAKNIEDDKAILQKMWELMDEADVIIGQNHKSFDLKKLNARFLIHGMQPPSSYRTIDTKVLAQKHFGFTSNKLEYMTSKLNKKYTKLKHDDFSGFELWKQCLAGNMKAWKSMEKYNKYDVLALEELYLRIAPWGTGINMNVYHEDFDNVCNSCGGKHFTSKGYAYTNAGKFKRLKCTSCGCEHKVSENLFTKEKKKALKGNYNAK